MSAPTRPSANREPATGRTATSRGRPDRRQQTEGRAAGAPEHPRPLYTAGGMAAAWAAGIGLAVLMTFTLIGWVAAPHGTIGEDIADVFRTAVQAWLVGHQVGFAIPGGQVSMLPIGLVVLPGLLLYRSGRWLARSCELPRLRHLFRAALAVAGPYAAISGTLALVGQSEVVRPGVLWALPAGFVFAFLASGLGVLHQQLNDKGIPKRRLLEVLPDRSRSLLAGTLSATGILLLTGLLLFLVALGFGIGEAATVTDRLSPGIIGGSLLVIVQLLYLPNAVVFGLAYSVGPGFSVGAGTMVAPTGVAVGAVPMFPMLAALPDNGPAPALSLVALAAPFVAGGVAGVLTQRSAPTVVSEAAPLWGFACGVATGLVCAALSLLAGGSVGAERLATVGPSAWQVGLITALEVGVAAAIAAWVANWRHHRRATAEEAEEAEEHQDTEDTVAATDPDETPARSGPLRLVAVRDDAPAPETEEPPEQAEQEEERQRSARRRWRPWPTSWRPRLPRRRRRAVEDEEPEVAELCGITYEADPGELADPAGDGAEGPSRRS